MAENARIRVICPDCSSRLTVDRATGEVLAHERPERPPAGGKELAELVADLDRGKEEAEDVFQREVSAFKDRDRLLEEKFREAMKRAEDDDGEPPPRPFDYD